MMYNFYRPFFQQQSQQPEMYHDSIPGNRFPSAVSKGQLQKKIPSKTVSSSSPVSILDSANVIWPAFLKKSCWNSFYLWPKTISRPQKGIGARFFLQFQHLIRKIFKQPQAIQWNIVDKETVDEIIFRTMNTRKRLILELMARGGMRAGEVLNLTPTDIHERTLAIKNPKSGRV
jgi:hypothetical protein